jgi:branched-chain amino acid transport system ATP-binding protein
MSTMLRLDNVRKAFGGLVVTDNVSLHVAPGERRAIIGPNGAGKTTLFNLISGVLPVQSGQIWLGERDVTRLAMPERAQLGLGRTFQRNNLFLELPVLENVRLAVQHRHGLSGRLFAPVARYNAVADEAQQLLEQVGLGERASELASALAYGQQRALEIALALAMRPQLLLLDEPTAGMSPAETGQMIELIAALPRTLTLLIIEHDMDAVFRLADRVTVLSFGRVLAEGSHAEIRANATVQEVYLGHAAPEAH